MRLPPAIAAALLAACGGADDPARPGPPATPEGDAITSGSLALTLSARAQCQGAASCARTPGDVTLWLAVLDGGSLLRVSSAAAFADVPMDRGAAHVPGKLLLQQEELGQTVLDELSLELLDGDGDHALDAARARGSGHFGFLDTRCGATASRGLFTLEQRTASAYEPPAIAVDDAVWPASGIPVRSVGAAMRITSAEVTVGDSAFELSAPPGRDVEVALPPAPLPFGQAGLLALGIEDITGSALARTAAFRTVDLSPGVMDGSFESGTLAGIAARGVQVVDRFLVPGTGARFAYARQGTLTFPVQVPAAGGAVRFRVQALNQPGRVEVRTIGRGGFATKTFALQVTEDVRDVPAVFAPGTLQAVSPALDASMDVGAHAGSRAVVEIRLEGPALCEVESEFAGFALDDLSLP